MGTQGSFAMIARINARLFDLECSLYLNATGRCQDCDLVCYFDGRKLCLTSLILGFQASKSSSCLETGDDVLVISGKKS